MLKTVLAVLLGLFVAFGGLSYAAAAKKAPASRSKVAAKSKKKPSARSSKKLVRRGVSSKKKKPSAKRATARRSTQQVPTPERYMEIQRALADKGYYEGPVNGTWGASSVDALRRFQRDRHLAENGKLDSLTIIALGLGPKRNLSARSTTESRATEDDHRRPEGSERP